ncbi:kinase-like domain-containing protein [Rhizophagus clarus]|nr:kinase-like domain-containing protein [Rhizophagus clarus]
MATLKPAITIRIAFCGYRDHCDGPDRLQIFDFINSCDEFKNNLSNVPATGGGGDGPEDVLGGLNAAITELSWRNHIRVLLHIGDFPPHGRRFDNEEDDYPDGDPNGLTAEQVLDEMRSAGIHYFFGRITEYTDTMIRIFKSIIGEFPVFDFESTPDPEGLVEKFFDATCSAINTAITLRE